MNEKEKKAVEFVKKRTKELKKYVKRENELVYDDIILNLIEKLQEENKKLKNSLIKAEKELIQNTSEEKDTDISAENNIKYVDLVFENCEVARLYPNMFKYLVIGNIAKNKKINCFQYENGESWDNSSCSYFAITILPEGYNQKMDWVNQLLKERLKNNNDVTCICLTYNNGKEEDIYVPWNENNDYINEYQKTQFESDSINIEIKKE